MQPATVDEIPTIDPTYHDDRLKNIFQYYSINPEEMERIVSLCERIIGSWKDRRSPAGTFIFELILVWTLPWENKAGNIQLHFSRMILIAASLLLTILGPAAKRPLITLRVAK